MTVFEKLNEARLRFQNAGVKKSGKNSYAGYTYYELADILPFINQIANELKFTCIVNFTPELATLDFVDLEENGKITFTSPMSSASLKGCHEVQNLGAVETYIKRYLYQNCFEIVEADVLDETMNPSEKSNSEDVEDLIKKVNARMNTMTDEQLTFAKKAIANKDVQKLKIIIASYK
jgi:hypothetical protein